MILVRVVLLLVLLLSLLLVWLRAGGIFFRVGRMFSIKKGSTCRSSPPYSSILWQTIDSLCVCVIREERRTDCNIVGGVDVTNLNSSTNNGLYSAGVAAIGTGDFCCGVNKNSLGRPERSPGLGRHVIEGFCWGTPIQGNAGMWRNALARADEVDDVKSLTRLFRLTVHPTVSPKIGSFKAFFIFSKSFTETVGFVSRVGNKKASLLFFTNTTQTMCWQQ